jgi:hypothetical protein
MNTKLPPDGARVFLTVKSDLKSWLTTVPFEWNGKRWVSTVTGLPLPSGLDVIGWIAAAEPTPTPEEPA